MYHYTSQIQQTTVNITSISCEFWLIPDSWSVLDKFYRQLL